MSRRAGVRVRCTAARVLSGVLAEGQTLNVMLESEPARSETDQALLRQLSFGTLRYLLPLRKQLAGYLKQPIKRSQTEVESLLLLGLYQINLLRVPDHAAVSTSVEAARKLGKSWAAKLINAVLRSHIRAGKPPLDIQPTATHPKWLRRHLERDWGPLAAEIMRGNDEQAPLWLRANTGRIATRDLLQALLHRGYDAVHCERLSAALRLPAGAEIASLPGYDDGHFSVQDAAAQLAAPLLDPRSGERILDACAAPGGKTTHLLELAPNLDLLALDRAEHKLARVRENLRRLGQRARVQCADARNVSAWWDGNCFDGILLDAPCSATGIIRRHPDIRHLRTASQVSELIQLQADLLDSLWTVLRPGGRLVYVTCSVLREENDAQIARFCDRTPTVRVAPLAATWGQELPVGRQTIPGENDMDGFFFAILRKGP